MVAWEIQLYLQSCLPTSLFFLTRCIHFKRKTSLQMCFRVTNVQMEPFKRLLWCWTKLALTHSSLGWHELPLHPLGRKKRLSPLESTGMSSLAVDWTSVVLAGDFKNSFSILYIFPSCRGTILWGEICSLEQGCWMSCTVHSQGDKDRALAFCCSVICYLLARLTAILLMALFSPSPRSKRALLSSGKH